MIEPDTLCTHCGKPWAEHAGDLQLPVDPPAEALCHGAKFAFGTGPCWACGKTFAQHADVPQPGKTARMPCLGIRAHFRERDAVRHPHHHPAAISALLACVDLGMRLHRLDRDDELYNCAAHLVRATVAYVDATDTKVKCTGAGCPLCELLRALKPFVGEL